MGSKELNIMIMMTNMDVKADHQQIFINLLRLCAWIGPGVYDASEDK